MNFANATRNQHFVSQSEQRMNAYSRNNIYEFSILQRGIVEDIRLSEPVPRAIARNLAIDDLFSFDVAPKAKLRENFEELFQQYEVTVSTLTGSLLEKVAAKSPNVVAELTDLFAAKLMNFARNPYCVQKMLNTFPAFKGMHPTDPEQNSVLEKVLIGRKPRQKYICEQLGITDVQYREWLATLFMLLADFQQGRPNFLGQAVAGLFNSGETSAAAMVCTYTTESVLLSDRAMTSNLQSASGNGFDFNLCSTAFVRYVFMDKAAALKGKAHPSFIKSALEFSKRHKPVLSLFYENDNLELLKNYNWHVINQSHERVFCASKTVLL
ncbi:hypothetical protein [Herbaspirillum frisingense]|uniref:hypothetical protein n=1 Tax=Herbaspirillum frisingense TaxID=92645 RepID=UPI001F22CFA3|nr:hypothetical protein [Herbaspirillum frisingense]UIN21196.1 hypothetical protein LAZ82_22520 [Herbaspirillum frisingense]